MVSLDPVEFIQALLTTFFLASLSVLVPKILSALSVTSQSATLSCYFDNLFRHNPFQQWMAERQLTRHAAEARLRALDEQTGCLLSEKRYRAFLCPNRRWFLVSVVFVLIHVTANIAGALTIMWQETIAVPFKRVEEPLYPAFPVTTGQNLMIRRGNCKYTTLRGSGTADKVGFVIYQICLDVFNSSKSEPLRRNEVRAVTNLDDTVQYWKMPWSLETLTQHGVDEDWRVSANNEARLENARGVRNYLNECDGECSGILRGKGVECAMIHEALKEAGMVRRTIQHYNSEREDFDEMKILLDRKTRLKNEAWITMIGVTAVAFLWSCAGLVGSEAETDFAIVTRISRSQAANGPTTIETVLRPGTKMVNGFVVKERKISKAVMNKILKTSEQNDDVVLSEEAQEVIHRFAQYEYSSEHQEPAKQGMIFVVRRAEDDESSSRFEDLVKSMSQNGSK